MTQVSYVQPEDWATRILTVPLGGISKKDAMGTIDDKSNQGGMTSVDCAFQYIFIKYLLDVAFEIREWPGRLGSSEEMHDPEVARIVRGRDNVELAYLQDRL